MHIAKLVAATGTAHTWHSRQPWGIDTKLLVPSASHTDKPGNRLLPCICSTRYAQQANRKWMDGESSQQESESRVGFSE